MLLDTIKLVGEIGRLLCIGGWCKLQGAVSKALARLWLHTDDLAQWFTIFRVVHLIVTVASKLWEKLPCARTVMLHHTDPRPARPCGCPEEE